MKLSEARKRWKHYMLLWQEGAYEGPEFAREMLGKDLKIYRLREKLHEYTKLADILEENCHQLIHGNEMLRKSNLYQRKSRKNLKEFARDLLAKNRILIEEMEPFMAQITQAKTYKVGEDPATYQVSDQPSSGDMAGGEN